MLGPVNAYTNQAQIANGIKTSKETEINTPKQTQETVSENQTQESKSALNISEDVSAKSDRNRGDQTPGKTVAERAESSETPERGSIIDITV